MNHSRISSRVGFLFSSSSAFAATMNPGVQKPHWTAPFATNAHWMAWRQSGVPRPSIVRIADWSGTSFILVTQERTTFPLRITLQAPHWPCPHPTLVPVSPSCFRITLASNSSGFAMTVRGTPLMTRVFFEKSFIPSFPPFPDPRHIRGVPCPCPAFPSLACSSSFPLHETGRTTVFREKHEGIVSYDRRVDIPSSNVLNGL